MRNGIRPFIKQYAVLCTEFKRGCVRVKFTIRLVIYHASRLIVLSIGSVVRGYIDTNILVTQHSHRIFEPRNPSPYMKREFDISSPTTFALEPGDGRLRPAQQI